MVLAFLFFDTNDQKFSTIAPARVFPQRLSNCGWRMLNFCASDQHHPGYTGTGKTWISIDQYVPVEKYVKYQIKVDGRVQNIIRNYFQHALVIYFRETLRGV